MVTYVQNGVTDLGVAGKDDSESDSDVYETLDLGFENVSLQ